MTEYVVGFIFPPCEAEHLFEVLLVRKTHPEWQNGKLNGVGGAVRPGENALEAMVRETREETGLSVPAEQWECFAVATGSDYRIKFFETTADVSKRNAKNKEPVSVYDSEDILDEGCGKTIVPDLAWLLPLARDKRVLRPIYYTVK
jgi:8-oxo-dGTP diphosphatase